MTPTGTSARNTSPRRAHRGQPRPRCRWTPVPAVILAPSGRSSAAAAHDADSAGGRQPGQSALSGGGGGGSGEPKDQDQGGKKLAQQNGEAGTGEPTGSGQQASTGAAGMGRPIDPEGQDSAIEQLRKEWGILPPRVREELSDGLRERFSPLYRRMTEAYYKALAEQE